MMKGTRPRTSTLPTLLFLLLVPLPTVRGVHGHGNHPDDFLTCLDLKNLVEVFRGQFNNFDQNELDKFSSVQNGDFHFFIQRFQVPITVRELQPEVGKEPCTQTRQVYLEQYLNILPFPQFQRIFNFILTADGHIEMETHQHRNLSAVKSWGKWRENLEQFEDLKADDLQYDPKCNVQWTKVDPGHYKAHTIDNNCAFSFLDTKVYLQSKVYLSNDLMIQDEQFISVDNQTIVSGTYTPYIYKKQSNSDIPPVPDLGTCQRIRCRACFVVKTRGQGLRKAKDLMKQKSKCFPFL